MGGNQEQVETFYEGCVLMNGDLECCPTVLSQKERGLGIPLRENQIYNSCVIYLPTTTKLKTKASAYFKEMEKAHFLKILSRKKLFNFGQLKNIVFNKALCDIL